MIGSDACLRRLAIWFEPGMTARAQTWKASGNALPTLLHERDNCHPTA
jgi:hypothetical protein